MKQLKKFICPLLFLFLSVSAFAQTTVKGKVTDSQGSPLAGVSVIVDGTTTGTATLADGTYVLKVPQGGKTLVFSFIGMQVSKVNVGNKTVINVTMADDQNYLDDVVVVGYGVQKKAHMTGSVVAVSGNELKKSTVANVSQALVGKLPGVVTQQGQGLPGADAVSILIRGYSSYNDSGKVLVLVDGVERDMNLVNPADIESISVLKDAAACSVYGMKGANGVILVTTRRGDEGTAQVNYSGKLTLSNPTAYPKMMNGTQYMQYYNIATMLDQWIEGNPDPQPFFTDMDIAMCSNGDPTDGFENTDWTAPLYKTTLMHQHNVSVSGGSKKVSYFVSGGFLDQNGFFEGHKYQRGNFRSNVDARPTENLLVGLSVSGTWTDSYSPGYMDYTNAKTGGTVPFCLMYALPFVPKEIDGYPTSPMRTASSFVANAEENAKSSGFHDTKYVRLQTDAKVEYNFPFLKGLKAAMAMSWDWSSSDSKTFANSYYLKAYQFATKNYTSALAKSSVGLDTGNLYVGHGVSQDVLLRPSLSFNRAFGKHDVGALLLYEQVSSTSSVLDGSRQNFALLDLTELSLGDSKTATNSGSSGASGYAGSVLRLNYAYAGKYLVELAGRYDGSYLFAPENRWGFFPSASMGWNISEESWFKAAVPAIERLKIRGSIGETGNDNTEAFLWTQNFKYNNNATAMGQVAQATLTGTNSYPQRDLTWERIRTMDAGFEMSAWKGLLSVEGDVFYKFTYHILNSLSSAFPPSLGGHYPTRQNSGEFDSRGFELSLKHYNHIGDFTYSINGNVSWARSRVLKRVEADNVLPWQSTIGQAYGAVWGFMTDGLYQTEEELANAPSTSNGTPKLGDIKYVDYDGDGQITYKDKVLIGRNARPELMYSLQMDASWHGIDVSIQFQGGALCDKFLMGTWANGVTDLNPLTRAFYAGYDNAPLFLVEQSWRPDNTNARFPRLSQNGSSHAYNASLSDFWKINGAYVRLKNASIGYTIPAKITRRLKINKTRIFCSGYNLFTLTEFPYLDPESPNNVTGYYPQQRTITFGVDLSF